MTAGQLGTFAAHDPRPSDRSIADRAEADGVVRVATRVLGGLEGRRVALDARRGVAASILRALAAAGASVAKVGDGKPPMLSLNARLKAAATVAGAVSRR